MKNEINPLIKDLLSSKISNAEFCDKYFKNIVDITGYILGQIDVGIKNKNEVLIEELITVISTNFLELSLFTGKLCELILYDWHKKHEDIAFLLKEIADKNTVDCLFKAATLNFEYLDYDDTYQFARKCIKALAAINDENAISKLKMLTKSETPEIRDYATKELRYKGLL